MNTDEHTTWMGCSSVQLSSDVHAEKWDSQHIFRIVSDILAQDHICFHELSPPALCKVEVNQVCFPKNMSIVKV